MIYHELKKVVEWYQKRLGSYDRQQWEHNIEQRIVDGLLLHVPRKSARLKTELIDLDLVRGSSFPKAKPKHGLVTITHLALVRLLFLPLYWEYWIKQTSALFFGLLVALYTGQVINILLYWNFLMPQGDEESSIPLTEVLVPCVLMVSLSIVHGQMVCTQQHQSTSRSRKTKSKRNVVENSTGSKRKRRVRGTRSRSSNNNEPKDACEKSGPSIVTGVRRRNVARSTSLEIHSSTPKTEPLNRERASSEQFTASGLESHMLSPVEHFSIATIPEVAARGPAVRGEGVEDDGFESLSGFSDNSDKIATCTFQEVLEEEPQTVEITASVEVLLSPRELNLTENDNSTQMPSEIFAEVSSAAEAEAETDHEPVNSGHIRLPDGSPPPVRGFQSSIRRRRLPSPHMLQVQFRPDAQESSYNSSCESDPDLATSSAPDTPGINSGESKNALDWTGVTTNSEECSYSSGEDAEESDHRFQVQDGEINSSGWDQQGSYSNPLSPSGTSSDKVSCTIWEQCDSDGTPESIQKADLSALDISSAIVAKVDALPDSSDYLLGGACASVVLALLPSLWRLVRDDRKLAVLEDISLVTDIINVAFGSTLCERIVIVISLLERFLLGCGAFFLLTVAERTFKQRFLYAKLFSHLTSSRRARKSDVPHFRLNKVRNIKTWLSVRSYLKKRGPQRSVDLIVSASFVVSLLLVFFLSVELLKNSERLQSLYNIEVICWCLALGVFLLRFMTLGTKTNAKYRNLSVLITEQINLYLHMEHKPHKKDELMVANNVLKLAADLLKELENPFKISGFAANPYLYNITKLVILSAFSGVLSEMLGFKLKLYKIKLK